MDCMRLAAKQIDAKSMFGALEKDWERAAGMGQLVSDL
jgi:U3 small nucleolar RNA-associated protein 10